MTTQVRRMRQPPIALHCNAGGNGDLDLSLRAQICLCLHSVFPCNVPFT